MLIIKIAVWVFMLMLLAGIVAYYIDQQREYKAINNVKEIAPPKRLEIPMYQAPVKQHLPVSTHKLEMETTFYDPAAGVDVTITV